MPSLRQKVTTYFRQLSFIADARDGPRSPRKGAEDEDGSFITKYLEGRMERIFVPGPDIYNGTNPTDLPELHIASYPTGTSTITAACTGPDDGLTGIKRSKLHLSASYADDIDFIDTIQDSDCLEVRKSITTGATSRTHPKFGNRFPSGRKQSAATTPTSDQNANKMFGTQQQSGMRSRKNSKIGISSGQQQQQQQQQQHAVTTDANNKEIVAGSARKEENSNKATTIVVSMVSSSKAPTSVSSSPLPATKATTMTPTNNTSTKTTTTPATTPATTITSTTTATDAANDQNNKNLLNAKTDATKELTKDKSNNITNNTTTQKTTTTTANGTKDISTTKTLEDATARLLHAAVSNQPAPGDNLLTDPIAGVTNWKMESECAYGISVSLYENNMLTKEPMGNPIADCYGMVVRGDCAAMALADGVNWGDGARLAARSAVHGCLDYLDRAIFGLATECMATTTHDVFVSLLRALWEGHGCILEVGGALSTLTIAVVLPLVPKDEDDCGEVEKYVVCACNVGDSLGYVYSKKHGVREFTLASHDITSMRDMRDALGALGPADGNKPELSNLTLSMTVIERGDIVFLTSDGISDNFDPVVGKFAEAWTPDVKLMSSNILPHGVLAPKRQNKSASAIYARLHRNDATPPVRPPRTKKSSSPENTSTSSSSTGGSSASAPSRPKYMRSQTVIEPRRLSSAGNPALGHPHHHHQEKHHHHHQHTKIPKSVAGLPLVTGPQRHALTLYRLEDLLSYGINGTFSPCVSARRLCHLLIDFVRMITSARRKTLEQRELFYKLATGPDGIKREVELNRMQHRAARKRIVDSSAFASLPGKLDHATVVAYTVGGAIEGGGGGRVIVDNEATSGNINASIGGKAPLQSQEFHETNF